MILIKVDIYVKQMYVDISLVFELKRIIIEKNKMIILILKTNVYIFCCTMVAHALADMPLQLDANILRIH